MFRRLIRGKHETRNREGKRERRERRGEEEKREKKRKSEREQRVKPTTPKQPIFVLGSGSVAKGVFSKKSRFGAEAQRSRLCVAMQPR
jgi:hypothetical protein